MKPEDEQKATPPPDNPKRRSQEWEELETEGKSAADMALRRLKALEAIKKEKDGEEEKKP